MSRIYLPSTGPEDWQRLLAKPELHWRAGYSARTLAYCWDQPTVPPEITAVLEPTFGPVELLIGLPEHKTPLPGGRRESQSDLLALFRTGRGLLVCAVEGKVDEPFGPTVADWLVDASPGKGERLAYLRDLLRLQSADLGPVAYQLLHRTAAALIEARRFGATEACMLVHSFSPTRLWFDAFSRFTDLFSAAAHPDETIVLGDFVGTRLTVGWVTGDQACRAL